MAKAGWWLGAAVGLLVAGGARADGFHWSAVAEETIGHLEEVVAAYRGGRVEEAKEALVSAYFGCFEDRKMEAALRKEIGLQHTGEVEAQFIYLRNDVRRGASVDEIAAIVEGLAVTLRADAKILEERKVPEQVYEGR